MCNFHCPVNIVVITIAITLVIVIVFILFINPHCHDCCYCCHHCPHFDHLKPQPCLYLQLQLQLHPNYCFCHFLSHLELQPRGCHCIARFSIFVFIFIITAGFNFPSFASLFLLTIIKAFCHTSTFLIMPQHLAQILLSL